MNVASAEKTVLGSRPMWRRRLTFITSVMLIVVFVTLWICTYWANFDSAVVVKRPYLSILGIASADQRLIVMYVPCVDLGAKQHQWSWNSRFLTFYFRIYPQAVSLVASVHWWIATSFLTVVSLCALADVRRARRLQRQLGKICHQCGYDLRSSVGRCSECGAEILSR